jgi:hypothetical protein
MTVLKWKSTESWRSEIDGESFGGEILWDGFAYLFFIGFVSQFIHMISLSDNYTT